MKKKVFNKILCIVCVLLMVSYTFATSVSDNTGSSFITKAEFDSLKNSFQSQLDTYNTNIDTKIDEAIASYLLDISVSGVLPLALDGKCLYTFPITMHNDDDWNQRTSKYYSVSSPLIHEMKYSYGDTSASKVVSCTQNVIDHSKLECFTIGKYTHTGVDFALATLSLEDFNLKGIPGFLFSVGDTNGTRTIPKSAGGAATTYSTRPRLDCGFGNDNVVFLTFGWGMIGSSSARESIKNGNTSTTAPPAYCYTMMLGFGVTTSGGGGKPGSLAVKVSNPAIWTKTSIPTGSATGYGNNGGVRIPIADFGTTYNTYIAKVNAWGVWTGSWIGGASTKKFDYTTNPPITDQFNWQTSNQQTRVYTGFTNVPAEKIGGWALTPSTKNLTANSAFREIMMVDGSAKYGTSWNTGTGDHYYGPGLSFYYYVIPYWSTAANTDVMPPDGTDFSQLPASLVYYFDSNGDKHFLDEGMFLQTFTENGTATIDLKFGTDPTLSPQPKIDIIFSKKPFDRTWAAADALPVKVGTSTYTTYTLDTAGTKDVSFTIENINKNDKLYLKWAPKTAEHYVELVDIPKFELAYKK